MGNAITRLDDQYNRKIEDEDAPETFSRGVSLEFLKEILGRGEEYGTANGNGIRTLVTFPETEKDPETKKEIKCSLAEMYDLLDGPSGKPFIGEVQFFVSHAWKYKFSELVQAIERFENGDKKREGAYYFIDYFAVNQWKPKSDLKELGSVIKKSEALVMVLSPLKKPVLMTRCWCLYELRLAILNGKPIFGTVPDHQQRVLRTECIVGSKINLVVDAENAEASVAEDKKMIKDEIKDTIGFEELNRLARIKFNAIVTKLIFSERQEEKNPEFGEQLDVGLRRMFRDLSIQKQDIKELNKAKNTPDSFQPDSSSPMSNKTLITPIEKCPPIVEEPLYVEVPETIKCNHDWQFCSETWTPPESLGKVFVDVYRVVIGKLEDIGELEDISEVILKYIGGCGCSEKQLSQGIFSAFIHSGLCDHCKGNCICEESIFLCNVCLLRGINYCTRCKFRHVGSHQCK